MNIQRWTNDMIAASKVETILTLAGTDYETGLINIAAVSEKQRQFGADVRIRALASVWDHVDEAYKTAEFANAVLRAANKHANAKWWIDRESHTLAFGSFHDLDEDIDQELG